MSTEPTSIEFLDVESSFNDRTIEEMAASSESETEVENPTLTGESEAAVETPEAGTIPIPTVPKIPFPIYRPESGLYRGTMGVFQLELRVDVDRTRPMKRLSGDFYQVSGGTTSYFGSFIVNSVNINVTSTSVTIQGLGSYTFSATCPVVKVNIPRRTIFQTQPPATIQFFTTRGSLGATYICSFGSIYFRSVWLETDRVSDVPLPVFNSYNTGALPSGGTARNMSVISAYAEAGIQMNPTTGSDVINISEAGADFKWSNAELHASMVKHFSLWKDSPQWAVWQLIARLHEMGSGLYGIMFDQQGKQRQGCAVFYEGIGGTSPEKLRLQLYTQVHELGHCFNLLHSWQKKYANPPVPNRSNALSWMNYPWYYPSGGAASFWNNFPFQFDNEEVIHLRHAFRNNIIMGGNDFAVGSAFGKNVMPDSIRDESGLRFKISTHQPSFALGEPVVLQLLLNTSDSRGRRIHTWLHPNYGMVKIVIRKPNREVVSYEPLIDHLVGAQTRTIAKEESIMDSAYIGYGKGAFYFDQPGYYLIRAAYAALDGSEVLSDIISVRVRYPVTATDEALAELFIGEDQGTLLYLLGSDAESLRHGNNAFDEVLEKYSKNPMANYVRLIKGINASRTFKTISEENTNKLVVRKPEFEDSANLLSFVADSKMLDSVTTKMTLVNLADVQTKLGDEKAAKKTLDTLSAMQSGSA